MTAVIDTPTTAPPERAAHTPDHPVDLARTRGSGGRRRGARVEVLVFVAALLARLWYLFTGSGLTGRFGYDSGVYYAAADALTFGRLPYRDYTLLHPPGIALVLAPFAILGRLTTDDRGFAVATVAVAVLAALNAVLVMRIARRLGFGSIAALIAGLAYALSLTAIQAEGRIRLEPVGNFAMLAGLLALAAARFPSPDGSDAPVGVGRLRLRRESALLLLGGVGFGVAASIKIWWIVPLLVVAVWQLVDRRSIRDAALVLGGGLAAICAICAPFFLAAPKQMFDDVIVDQLGRQGTYPSLATRIEALFGLNSGTWWLTEHRALAVTVATVLLGLAMCLAVRIRAARMLVVLTLAQLAVILLAPSWFSFYGDFVIPGMALCLGAGAAAVGATVVARRRSLAPPAAFATWAGRLVAGVFVVMLAVCSAEGVAATPSPSLYFPTAAVDRAVSGLRCVVADEPMALILTDKLSSGLAHGCQNWVDVTGRTYGPDDPMKVYGLPLSRPLNPIWQRDLLRYLRSGNAAITMRWQTGVSLKDRSVLRLGGVLLHRRGLRVYLIRY